METTRITYEQVAHHSLAPIADFLIAFVLHTSNRREEVSYE